MVPSAVVSRSLQADALPHHGLDHPPAMSCYFAVVGESLHD